MESSGTTLIPNLSYVWKDDPDNSVSRLLEDITTSILIDKIPGLKGIFQQATLV